MIRSIQIFSVILIAACSSDPQCAEGADCTRSGSANDTGTADDTGNEVDVTRDVQYVGGTTDEALLHLTDLTAQDSPSHRLALDSPTSAELSSDAPSVFSFHVQGASGSLRPLQPTRRTEAKNPLLPHWASRSLQELWHLVGPVRVAHAHGTPYNGDAFLLSFSNAEGDVVARVFTAEGSYTPSAEQWAAFTEEKAPLTLTVVWASFEENQVVGSGGPFLGLEFEFEIR
jgi:hypothetical protein